MLRCNYCGYNNPHDGRHGNKFGGCAAMSDTEYDNASDDDEGDWIDEPTVPAAADRFRSQTVQDRWYQTHERVPGPPTRQRVQPVQASLKFHPNSSFDDDSVCSGTFTIDLRTLQNTQNRHQPPRAANQPDPFVRSSHRSRPYSSVSVNDPECEKECRMPYTQPYNWHATNEHQPRFPSGRQYQERMPDDRRNYRAPRNQCSFGDENAYCEPPFRNVSRYDRNPCGYESASFSATTAGYRCQVHGCVPDSDVARCCPAHCGYHARVDGGRRLPRFAGGGFPDAEAGDDGCGQMPPRNATDPALHRSSAAGHRCSRSHSNDRRDEYRPQVKDRYDYVPTRDVPAPQMTRPQTASYHGTRTGHVDQTRSRYDHFPAPDDGGQPHRSSTNYGA